MKNITTEELKALVNTMWTWLKGHEEYIYEEGTHYEEFYENLDIYDSLVEEYDWRVCAD